MPIWVNTVTNGLLLNADISRRIIESGLDKVLFSIDGASEETYESIRKGGSYKKAVENIKEFLHIRNSLNSKKPFVRVQMVKMDLNIHEVDRFMDIWKEYVILENWKKKPKEIKK